MSKSDDNSRPFGICRRLINFINSNFIGQAHKRVALGDDAPPPCESTEVPIGDSSRNIEIMPSKSNGNGALSWELIIDFRHIEEPEISDSVQMLSSEVDFSKKNGLIAKGDQTLMQRGEERRHSGHQVEIDLPSTTKGKESAEDQRVKYKHKEKDIPTETSSVNESEEAKRKLPIIPSRPLLMSVPPNINEKADAFIRSRKEAMSKDYSFEPGKF